jgi:hypothetical protein
MFKNLVAKPLIGKGTSEDIIKQELNDSRCKRES